MWSTMLGLGRLFLKRFCQKFITCVINKKVRVEIEGGAKETVEKLVSLWCSMNGRAPVDCRRLLTFIVLG